MAKQTLFSKAAHVEVEGNHALRMLERRPDVVTYEVQGFGDAVIVQDYRTPAKRSRGPGINTPAHVTIRNQRDAGVLVQLRPTTVNDPLHMLWIAVGQEEFLPKFDCVFDLFDFDDDDTLAFLALYKRPRKRRLEEDYSFLSV